MMLRKITAVYSEKEMKAINAIFGQKVELNVKRHWYSYQCLFKDPNWNEHYQYE
jgi:hypothetical protein